MAIGQGDIDSPGAWSVLGLAVLTAAGLAVVVRRELRTAPAAAHALRDGLGTAPPHGRLPLARILFGPFFVRHRDVERVPDIRYGDAGARNHLDVYRHHSHPSGCPTSSICTEAGS